MALILPYGASKLRPRWAQLSQRKGRYAPTATLAGGVVPHPRDLSWRYTMIQSFRCKDAAKLINGERVARWVNIAVVAQRKLRQLNLAKSLADLRSVPGNQLEVLHGQRLGQHSIRINAQWRICFVWTGAGPADVEIVDYH